MPVIPLATGNEVYEIIAVLVYEVDGARNVLKGKTERVRLVVLPTSRGAREFGFNIPTGFLLLLQSTLLRFFDNAQAGLRGRALLKVA